jgi:hypothetical protein
MLATRLMSRLRKVIGPELPPGLVFDHPRFADLVEQADRCLAAGHVETGPVASGRDTGPFSLQQEEMLRVEAALGPSPVHNVVVALRAAVPVDPGRLRASLRSVLNRHPALRLGFREDEQMVSPPLVPAEVELDVVGGDPDEQRVRAAVRRTHLTPFDLRQGVPVRAQLFQRSAGDLVVLHLHHLSVDGVSQGLLVDDLVAAYGGARLGGPGGSEPGYLDYAAWQRAGHVALLDRSRDHWRAVVAALAADHPPGSGARLPGRYTRALADLPGSVTGQLREWVRALGATDFAALTAAVATGVAGVVRRSCVGVGTLLDNRSVPGLERLVGPLATSTLLAADTSGTPRSVVRAVRDQLTGARRWSNAPLGMLVDTPCAELGLDLGDLVDVVVAVDEPYRPAPAPGMSFTPVPDHGAPLVNAALGGPPSVALYLGDDDALRISVETTDGSADGARELLDGVVAAVRAFAVAPDVPVVEVAAG